MAKLRVIVFEIGRPPFRLRDATIRWSVPQSKPFILGGGGPVDSTSKEGDSTPAAKVEDATDGSRWGFLQDAHVGLSWFVTSNSMSFGCLAGCAHVMLS